MIASSAAVQTLDELREYVNETLCRHDQLLPGAFAMTQHTLTRAGRLCGVYFCLHGPRAVKYTAIYDASQSRILFYGPTGERFKKVQLDQAPLLAVANS